MIIGRRRFLAGLGASLVAAPALLRLPLEMPVRGAPLIIDAEIIAELMARLDERELFYFGAKDDCYSRFANPLPYTGHTVTRRMDWVG